MLISAHVLTGTMLGRLLSRRHPQVLPGPAELLTAAGLGVASHFACDSLPHWGGGSETGTVHDPEFLRIAIPDGLIGLALLASLVGRERGRRRALVAACALGACLPDADKVGEFIFGRSPYPVSVDRWHGSIQRESTKLLTSDVAIIVGLATVLLRGARRGA